MKAKLPADAQRIVDEAQCFNGALDIDIWYPRSSTVKAIQVGLMDVRAADSIRLEYDFDRDGWIVKQAQVFEWEENDSVCDPQWKEVAFVRAWASDTGRKDEGK